MKILKIEKISRFFEKNGAAVIEKKVIPAHHWL